MDVKKRLELIIKELGVSGREFAKECELSNFSSIGDRSGIDVLKKILVRFPQFSADWLITGDGEMLKEDKSNIDIEKTKDDFSVSDLVKAINNLSEAAIINAEANNRYSKNMERLLDMLTEDRTYQKKVAFSDYKEKCIA